MLGSGVNLPEINDGTIARRIGENGPVYLAETQAKTSKEAINILYSPSNGNSLLYPQSKLAVKILFDADEIAFYFPVMRNRFETLQTFLNEASSLPILNFSTINAQGKSYYQVKLDISKSEKGMNSLRSEWKEQHPVALELLIGTKDFFVYEWTYFSEDGEIDRYTLHDVELFAPGTLPQEKFNIPENYRLIEAGSFEEMHDFIDHSGTSKTERVAKDVKKSFTRFFKTIGTFCIESPWLACIIFVAIGIILIVTMLCIR